MKRLAVLILMVFMLCTSVLCAPVYKYEDTVPITDSVSLTNVREFHADHNISYSYIKMDLTDDRVKLKLLTSDEGTDVLSYMSELANTDKNTVAALNGDFFSIYSGNRGFSLGMEKKDGEILQSPINPDTMATVAYDGENVLMSYLDFHVFAVAENWEYKEIRHINKHTSYYGDLLMYTHEFGGGYSPAPGGEVVEVVVEDGIVTEFRRNMEPCKIPENGCVLVLSEGSSMFLEDNFSVGSKIKFDWYITPSLDDFDTAFGGGSMLVYEGKDVGKVGDYTHTVAGFNPRSAIGIDEEGKTLYLVAVDGRQESSRGMRMSHLAELLIELGCYTAVNLDGGGSTRMVASTLWDSDMHPVNNPTENRKVINAIGIVLDNGEQKVTEDIYEDTYEEADDREETDDIEVKKDKDDPEEIEETETFEEDEQTDETEDSEETEVTETDEEIRQEEISGIKIRPSKQIALVGERIDFEVVAHDEQLRSIPFDMEDVEFSASAGEFEDESFVSDIGGEIVVSAVLGDFYSETTVYCIDDVSAVVTDSVLYMQKDESREIPIYVFDYSGRFVKVENIDAFDISSSDDTVVSVEGNTLFAQNSGTAVVTVSKNGVCSYISVAVGSYTTDYLGDFEKKTGYFTSYPEDTKGDFELSEDFSFSGKLSGKLSFDFTDVSNEIVSELPQETVEAEYTKEGEVSFDEETEMQSETEQTEQTEQTEVHDISRAVYFSLYENVVFDEECNISEIRAFSENEFNHELRAQLIDASGKIKNVKFDGDVVSGTWSLLTLEVPKELKRPVSLSRVYVLYTPGEEKDEGSIYIDDISLVTSFDYVPPVSPANVYRHNENIGNVTSSVKISAVPGVSGKNLVSSFERARVGNMVLSENGIVISENLEKAVSEDDNAVYVHLDTSNGGIRSTDSSQWELLMQAADLSTRENLFIITNNGIFGNDEFENEVVRDYLASLEKQVFVVSPGDGESYMNIDGVKYFTVDSSPITDFSLLGEKRKNTVEFFFGENVTFKFISV